MKSDNMLKSISLKNIENKKYIYLLKLDKSIQIRFIKKNQFLSKVLTYETIQKIKIKYNIQNKTDIAIQ